MESPNRADGKTLDFNSESSVFPFLRIVYILIIKPSYLRLDLERTPYSRLGMLKRIIKTAEPV